MPRDHEARLFKTLVMMGIGLTGGAVVAPATGCGGSVTGTPDASYVTIHAPPEPDAEPRMAIGPEDAGDDVTYAMIGLPPDDAGYPGIMPRLPAEAGAAADAGDAGDASYGTIKSPLPDAASDAYPTIHPAFDAGS